MGSKLGFTSLSSSRPWPSCGHTRTHSICTSELDNGGPKAIVDYTESSLTNSSASQSFSTASEEAAEAVTRGRQSERLFFEPGETNSILEEAKPPYEESTVVVVDSEDPYRDFRVSMEEMVAAEGMKDWESLEDLLEWYLRVNEKDNHGYIIGAFVDLVVGLC